MAMDWRRAEAVESFHILQRSLAAAAKAHFQDRARLGQSRGDSPKTAAGA